MESVHHMGEGPNDVLSRDVKKGSRAGMIRVRACVLRMVPRRSVVRLKVVSFRCKVVVSASHMEPKESNAVSTSAQINLQREVSVSNMVQKGSTVQSMVVPTFQWLAEFAFPMVPR